MSMTADEIIRKLDLTPHPEGGYYRRTFCHGDTRPDGRGLASSIYYLLADGQQSHWHLLKDSTELWHWHSGSPLQHRISGDGKTVETSILGPDILLGQMPQIIVAPGIWQQATSTGAWTLVSCTVVPEFRFDSYILAPQDWQPGKPL